MKYRVEYSYYSDLFGVYEDDYKHFEDYDKAKEFYDVSVERGTGPVALLKGSIETGKFYTVECIKRGYR